MAGSRSSCSRPATLDKVHSLDLGADDYVARPFEIEELLSVAYPEVV